MIVSMDVPVDVKSYYHAQWWILENVSAPIFLAVMFLAVVVGGAVQWWKVIHENDEEKPEKSPIESLHLDGGCK